MNTRSRRSTRLLSRPTSSSSRPKRQVTVPPLIIISDSSSDDYEVTYMEPKATILTDLAKKGLRTPPKQVNVDRKVRLSSVALKKLARRPNQRLESPLNINDQEEIINTKENRNYETKKLTRSPQKVRSTGEHEKDHLVTPPKQRKIENNENSPTTPTMLLQRLSLMSSEEKRNRKKLFEENDLYQSARKALHSTYPTNMPGRNKELGDLREFILKHLNEETSGTLYVSGPPGTGKTASLNLILQEEKISCRLKDIYVNCTAIKSSGSIFSRIAKDLGLKPNKTGEKYCITAIENYLKKNHEPILLILDEIDQLESKKQSVLYTIFEWPANPNSKLILIGIANALDLTDRILPRLQARCELKPQLMHFAPYNKQQIVEIFTSRLKNAGVLDVFSPVALQMLAGKVAAISGDVRRALDIGRRVIELVDRKKSGANVLKSMENLAEELDAVEGDKKIETVDLKQVVKVLNNVYGTTQNLSDDVDDSFPLQQKIVVCALLLILKKAKNKDVTVGRLHEVYRKVCIKRNIQVVDQGEFVGICALIETKGILRIIKKKDPRMNKISLVWDEEEVAAALKDKQLISTILQDDECLGKL